MCALDALLLPCMDIFALFLGGVAQNLQYKVSDKAAVKIIPGLARIQNLNIRSNLVGDVLPLLFDFGVVAPHAVK